MGTIGHGYGSEWHLMRYMARHRQFLDSKILSAIGRVGSIEWLDFKFDSKGEFLDKELKGLKFLKGTEYSEACEVFKRWWPSRGEQANWDALCWFHDHNGKESEVLLIEAKAHLDELYSSCQAKESSRKQIKNAFLDVQESLGTESENDWSEVYYQQANRIAIVWFLCNFGDIAKRFDISPKKPELSARLINIYFIGEVHRGWKCPQSEEEWKIALGERDRYLGIHKNHVFQKNIQSIFITL